MNQSVVGSREPASPPAGAASVAIDGVGDQPIRATMYSDPSMVLVLVVLAALGVVGFALYVVQLAIRRRKR